MITIIHMYSKTKWYLKSVAVSYIYILIVADIRFLKGCVIFIFKVFNGEKWNLQTSAESNAIHFLEVRFLLENSKFDYQYDLLNYLVVGSELFEIEFFLILFWFRIQLSRQEKYYCGLWKGLK